MKRLLLIGVALLLVGCNRHEDAPALYVPHVAGQWAGNGTDDAIGYYNWSVVLAQSNDTASGTFTTSGGYGTTTGNIYLSFGPEGGSNLKVLTMTRTSGTICLGSATINAQTSITNTDLVFSYIVTDCRGTNLGGANLHKIAGTN